MALIKPTDMFGNRDPPEKEANEQYLFLLEFFVYRVTGERLAKLNRMFYVPTRVCLNFLNFDDEEIAVTPVDLLFEPQAGIADDVENFNSGRSVMFAMSRDAVIDKTMNFTIYLKVVKKMPDGIKPDVDVGKCELDMSKHFAALRKEMLQCWHANYPPPKIFEGTIDLSHDNEITGSMEIYVRLSSFGQSIVTEIETPSAEKKSSSYVFKSVKKDAKQLTYKCRLISSSKMDFCKDSRENIFDREACDICMAEKVDCSPCGFIGGASKNHRGFSATDQQRSGGEPDRSMKKLIHGDVTTRSWCPASTLNEPKTTEAECKIRGFHEQTKSLGLPIQSSRGPAEPCGKAVVLKVSGLLDVEDADGRRKNPTVTVANEADSMENNVDPEHDVFILRIGKKGLVGVGEKSDIQLEMRTPKGPERRPPIRYETREMQTDEGTEGKTKEPKSKGKGKGKKKK